MVSKAKYRIRNWKDYNRSLIQRGSITVWFSEDAICKWRAAPTGKRGRPSTYSDEAILTAYTEKENGKCVSMALANVGHGENSI